MGKGCSSPHQPRAIVVSLSRKTCGVGRSVGQKDGHKRRQEKKDPDVKSTSGAPGIHPQTDQQLRIERWPPTFFRAALDALVELAQIHTSNQCPDRPRRMVLANQTLHIHRAPAHLLSVYVADQRLLADGIFLAHAASLRQTSYFARLKFRGFLHSFKPQG